MPVRKAKRELESIIKTNPNVRKDLENHVRRHFEMQIHLYECRKPDKMLFEFTPNVQLLTKSQRAAAKTRYIFSELYRKYGSAMDAAVAQIAEENCYYNGNNTSKNMNNVLKRIYVSEKSRRS